MLWRVFHSFAGSGNKEWGADLERRSLSSLKSRSGLASVGSTPRKRGRILFNVYVLPWPELSLGGVVCQKSLLASRIWGVVPSLVVSDRLPHVDEHKGRELMC